MRHRIVTALVALTLLLPAAAFATPKGEELYARCLGCHSLDRHRTGPKHCDLLGRKAGSATGYQYSKAMKASKVTWTRKTLNWFLQSPMEKIPGTKMGFAGIKNDDERKALVDYLVAVNKDSKKCP